MKLTYQQLAQHLEQTLLPVYIISGDELFLKQDVLNQIRKAAKKAGYLDRVRLIPGNQFDWQDLYHQLYATSFFSTSRLIELDCRETLPNKNAVETLIEYAAHPQSAHILIIETDKLDLKITKSNWYQALEKIGAVLTLWPIAKEQLPQWIMQRAKKYKLTMQSDAVKLLADYVEGNLSAAAQMIEKIFLLRPTVAIDQTFISQIINDETRFNIFDLTENILLGDHKKVLHVLNHLKLESIEPTFILWHLTRELRILSDLCTRYQAGADWESLMKEHKIFPRKKMLIRNYVQKHTAHFYGQQLMRAAEIDKIIKGARPGKPWDELESFCLKLV